MCCVQDRDGSSRSEISRYISHQYPLPGTLKSLYVRVSAIIQQAINERWIVQTDDYNESGRVYLELADATPAEAARGLALLTKLVG